MFCRALAVGAAFAVNCVSSLKQHLAVADITGLSQDDISEIVKLAVFIKKRAAFHVERLGGLSSAFAELVTTRGCTTTHQFHQLWTFA